jgi:heme/copper-type cytochrome/quinol oxidase subunit 1
MILPGMGIISEIIPVFSRKPIFGYKMIAFSNLAIAGAGSLAWGHHMFTSGRYPQYQAWNRSSDVTPLIVQGCKLESGLLQTRLSLYREH